MPLRKWKCVLCGEDVIEGQRFTVLKDGFVHLECLYERIVSEGKMSPDVLALMDAIEALNYLIVRLKEAQRMARSADVRNLLDSIRVEVEKSTAQASNLLERLVFGEKKG